MKFKKIPVIVALGLVLLLAAGSAWATSIGAGLNTRPVSVVDPINYPSVTDPLGSRLQDIINDFYGPAGPPGAITGNVDALTDQLPYGVFQTSTLPTSNPDIFPSLKFEFSGNAANHTFGLWTATDTLGPISTAQIFAGSAVPGSAARVLWSTPTSGNILFSQNGLFTDTVANPFAGINAGYFGFYYTFGSDPQNQKTLYTYDGLNTSQPVGGNNGTAAALVYAPDDFSSFLICFDDLQVEPDYNDLVVKVESIKPVPVPGALLLLGAGLVRLAAYSRRRRNQA